MGKKTEDTLINLKCQLSSLFSGESGILKLNLKWQKDDRVYYSNIKDIKVEKTLSEDGMIDLDIVGKLQGTIELQNVEIGELKNSNDKLESNIIDLNNDILAKEIEIDGLNLNLEALTNDYRILNDEKTELQERYDKLALEGATDKELILSLQSDISNKEIKIAELESKVEILKDDIVKLNQEISIKNAELDRLTGENLSLKTQVTDLTDENISNYDKLNNFLKAKGYEIEDGDINDLIDLLKTTAVLPKISLNYGIIQGRWGNRLLDYYDYLEYVKSVASVSDIVVLPPTLDFSSIKNGTELFSPTRYMIIDPGIGATNKAEKRAVTENFTSTYQMFYGSVDLIYIKSFPVPGVTNASRMFDGCTRVEFIELFNFRDDCNTSALLRNCKSLDLDKMYEASWKLKHLATAPHYPEWAEKNGHPLVP